MPGGAAGRGTVEGTRAPAGGTPQRREHLPFPLLLKKMLLPRAAPTAVTTRATKMATIREFREDFQNLFEPCVRDPIGITQEQCVHLNKEKVEERDGIGRILVRSLIDSRLGDYATVSPSTGATTLTACHNVRLSTIDFSLFSFEFTCG